MSSWPEIITQEVLDRHELVTVAEIERDISDTLHDIAVYEQQVIGHRLIADSDPTSPLSRLEYFKASGKEARVNEMRRFVTFLEKLLEEKKKTL